MRRLLYASLACLGLIACSTHPDVDAQAIDNPEKEGMPGVMRGPFQDANVIRTRIPPALRIAELAPYARPEPADCFHISAAVQDLDDALGDDFDIEPVADATVSQKRARQAGEAMVIGVRQAATDFIPMRGWVRQLSGAARHDRQVRGAVYAGRVRRSYLKGLGEALGCPYPAAPKNASPLPVAALAATAKPANPQAAAGTPPSPASAAPPIEPPQ